MKEDREIQNYVEEENVNNPNSNVFENRFQSSILSGYQRMGSEIIQYPAED